MNEKEERADEITEQNVESIAKMEQTSERTRKTGAKVADNFARIVGSWTFIIIQSILLFFWVVLNVSAWVLHWDPYPFILLNLALSFQAAYASPIIMMSQNRQARVSERRNQLDLQINLLSEQENTVMLRLLHQICEKLEIPIEEETLAILERKTEPDRIIREIEARIEKNRKNKKNGQKLR